MEHYHQQGENHMHWTYSGLEATLESIQEHVGVGWHKIIEDLVNDLDKLGWDGNIDQVKEKFGGLRFYISNGSDEIFHRIGQSEIQCAVTCEVCGKAGTIQNNGKGWLKCLCINHGRKNNE